ncbi:MAG: DUF309 domain-containing protein [Pseudomonadota bacterium]
MADPLAPQPPSDVALPPHAYVPGLTTRHDPQWFSPLHASVREGMSVADLAQSRSFLAGLTFYDHGYFWEAHEALEPVWMALPAGGPDRASVQAVIQLANAALKLKMERPNATRRLCEEVRKHLAASQGATLPVPFARVRTHCDRLEEQALTRQNAL